MNHHKGSKVESIPIRVVHERSDGHAGSPGSKKYGGTRNTTELPAARSPAESSPRIARAHSEPPKAFQKAFAQMRHPDQVPIPEGDVPENLSVPGGAHPGSNLEHPAHNLATSASAPSVPSSQRVPENHHRASPVPPPRRGSPTKSHAPPYHDDIRKQSAPPGVRHIPIFVEGREEPVVNRERQRPASFQQNHGNYDGGFTKPSDLYPAGTRKATRGDEKPFPNLRTQQQPAQGQQYPTEPTSPISPPPGPIPMGFVPKEPTSPLPAPDGPIPLPCSPNLYNNVNSVNNNNNTNTDNSEQIKKEEEERQRKPTMVPPPPPQRKSSAEKLAEEKERKDSFSVPIKVVQEPEQDSVDSAQPPQRQAPEEPPKPKEEPQKKANDPSLEKLEKIQTAVAELVAKIEAFKGSKKDKEYLYLDEMLTRQLLALDGIETGGRDELRKMRKESIKSVNRCLSMLDSKAKAANASKDAKENNDILDALAAKSKAEAAAK